MKIFSIEFFVSYGDSGGEFNNPVIMGLDELSFYLNKRLNEKAIKEKAFPKLSYLSYNKLGDDFISYGRNLRNQYFPEYTGPVFSLLDFNTDLSEVYAVASNSLAFLIRFQERVRHELYVAKNQNYTSALNIYPRFNNAVAETASYIYNTWERIAFLINEFFPILKDIGKININPPSYNQYFNGKKRDFNSHPIYLTPNFLWFYNRLEDQHKTLSDLRHPLIHYNKFRPTKGMRSAKMVKESLNMPNLSTMSETFDSEINFLRTDLSDINLALIKALEVIREWADLNNQIST